MNTAADRVEAFLEALPADQNNIGIAGGVTLMVADLVALVNRDRAYAPKPVSCSECGAPVAFANEHLKGGIVAPGWRCPA